MITAQRLVRYDKKSQTIHQNGVGSFHSRRHLTDVIPDNLSIALLEPGAKLDLLENTIVDGSQKLEHYLEYADWLFAEGDSRGQLIFFYYRSLAGYL